MELTLTTRKFEGDAEIAAKIRLWGKTANNIKKEKILRKGGKTLLILRFLSVKKEKIDL